MKAPDPFKIIEWAIRVAPSVIDLGARIVRVVLPRGSRPTPRTWDRPHFWTVINYNAWPWAYACQWCKVPRTAANETSVCGGPKI